MKNKDLINCFVCIAVISLLLGLAFTNTDKVRSTDKKDVKAETGLIKRSPTGQFTRGGSSTLVSRQKKRPSNSRIIYIGEPTAGLLDF